MQKRLYFDESRCTACETCVIACKDWHDLELGVHWLRVKVFESGVFPRVKLKYRLNICRHCRAAPCIEGCPTEVIIRMEAHDGVLVDKEKCIGCGDCFASCPFGIPQFGEDGKMQKCDLCRDRVVNDQNPVCVDACPTRALFFGDMQELRDIRESKMKRG